MIKKKITVNAVLDKDIEQILKQTNQYESLIKGNLKCENCGVTITPENIGIIQPEKSQELNLLFYCERLDCIEEYNNQHGK